MQLGPAGQQQQQLTTASRFPCDADFAVNYHVGCCVAGGMWCCLVEFQPKQKCNILYAGGEGEEGGKGGRGKIASWKRGLGVGMCALGDGLCSGGCLNSRKNRCGCWGLSDRSISGRTKSVGRWCAGHGASW
jgi:hypothetical protein